MTTPVEPTSGRRDFLRLGGLSAATAAVLAACAKSSTAKPPPRVQQTGNVPTTNPNVAPATVPDKPVVATQEQSDLAGLRTATSLEFALVNAYKELSANRRASNEFKTLADHLITQHSNAAKTFQDATAARLAEVQSGPNKAVYKGLTATDIVYVPGNIKDETGALDNNGNAYVWASYVQPRFAALTDTESVWTLALDFENTATATQVLYAGSYNTKSLRQTSMFVGSAEARQASYIQLQINPSSPDAAAPNSLFYTRNAIGTLANLTWNGKPPKAAA